jgi:hypothetical protein
MTFSANPDGVPKNKINPVNFSTEHAAAVIVIGSLALLIAIRRGFRGVGVVSIR